MTEWSVGWCCVLVEGQHDLLIIGGCFVVGVVNELLIIALDLVKTRVCVLNTEMRKLFVSGILMSLIDKTSDVKVMKAITRMVEEWVKAKSPGQLSQTPSLREKCFLLAKLMASIDKRFPDELDLQAQFLELVNYIYREESLSGTDLTNRLEPAFLAGLRCPQPHIRQKFMEIFDSSIKKTLFDRLAYVLCTQNWESMIGHFWIKQVIEVCHSGWLD